MKKLLIIHESMNGGGAEKVLSDLLANFDYCNYSIDLLLDKKVGVHLKDVDERVNVFGLHQETESFIEKLLFRFKPILDLLHKRMLRMYVKPGKYDVIISFMEGPSSKYHSLVKDKTRRNLTWIHADLSVNHWSLKKWRSEKEEAEFYRNIDRVICVSNGVKTATDKLFGLKNSLVLYNLINCNYIRKKGLEVPIEKKKFTICNVGRLVSLKRQDRIIEIAKILKSRELDVEFWIIGNGPLEASLKKQAHIAGVDNMVLFKGYQCNPYPYIYNADLFLLTSDTEGYPTVVCEALCLGKPIVSTNVTGVDELLGHDAGLISNFNVTDIADKIETLVNHPNMLVEYAASAEKRSQIFNKEKIMEQIYSVIG